MKFDSAKCMTVLLLLLPSLGMAAEQAMGRLFFTPEQRARMDVARQQERSVKFDMDQPDNEPLAANITLNGVITRSDGKTTVWINNKPQSGEKTSSGVSVSGRGKPAGQISVIAPDAKRAIQLKVGQSIDMSSGQVEEAYKRTPPLPVSREKEVLPASGVAKSPVLPGRKDDASADVQGETPPPR